jgi:hypothetical protein
MVRTHLQLVIWVDRSRSHGLSVADQKSHPFPRLCGVHADRGAPPGKEMPVTEGRKIGIGSEKRVRCHMRPVSKHTE